MEFHAGGSPPDGASGSPGAHPISATMKGAAEHLNLIQGMMNRRKERPSRERSPSRTMCLKIFRGI